MDIHMIKKQKVKFTGAVIVFLSCVLLAPLSSQSQPSDITKFLDMWRAEKYPELVPQLLEHRKSPYGKNIQVDYMLATACCRMDSLADVGQVLFKRILSSYELSKNDLELILNEQDHCAMAAKPVFMAFLNERASSRSDVGVSGKTFYWLGRQDAPVGTELIQVVRDIPMEEFQSRLFSPEQQSQAVEKVRSLAGTGFTVQATRHFIIATSSGQTPSQIQAIGEHLEKVMAFFNTEYKMPLPEYRVTVYISPDQGKLKRMAEQIHGLRLAYGSIGYSHRDDLSISSVSRNVQAGTLKHELFHLMVRHNFGDIPPWLDEGLASLYEVSRIEGSRVQGLRNWREDVLKRFWDDGPPIGALVEMPWQVFNAKDYDLTLQAVHHATARYFIYYLQERQKLAAVYAGFQQQTIDPTASLMKKDGKQVLETALQMTVDQIDGDFENWFLNLGKKASPSDIKVLQKRLNELGFNAGVADGLWGMKTKSALQAFQVEQGLTPTGELDDETLATLYPPAAGQ